MVGAPAAADAVRRALRLPKLRVGLHVVLVCGRPILPPAAIPDLVDDQGLFATDLVRAGFAFFFRPSVRRQVRSEIRAQFERFRETGLRLDHVNAHNHMHLHPTVLNLILDVGREFGVRAIRVPYEPFFASMRVSPGDGFARLASAIASMPLFAFMRWRLRVAGIAYNDFVFGVRDTGRMDRTRILAYLANLPEGVSEIYCHPATGRWPDMDRLMAHYRVEDELAALTADEVGAAMAARGIVATTFEELASGAPV